jgi:hypothetical protein
MRNSAPHDIELCRTISTEFKSRSTGPISWFNFISRSTYLVWILFQFRQSDRIRFIIIQRLLAHNNIDHYRRDLRIVNAIKKLCRGNISWARGPAELKLNWAGRAQAILSPLWAEPGHFFVARFEHWFELKINFGPFQEYSRFVLFPS